MTAVTLSCDSIPFTFPPVSRSVLCQEEGQGAKSKTQGPKRGRENFVSAAVGDEVLVWGGVRGSGARSQLVDAALWAFNVRKRKWQMLHNGKGVRPEPTEFAASFVIQDTLYIHGGQNDGHCAQVDRCFHAQIRTGMREYRHTRMHATFSLHARMHTRKHARAGSILGMEARGAALATSPDARRPSALAHRGCRPRAAVGCGWRRRRRRRGRQDAGGGVWRVF